MCFNSLGLQVLIFIDLWAPKIKSSFTFFFVQRGVFIGSCDYGEVRGN